MWALRRASIQLKNRGLSSGTTRIFCVKSEIGRCYLESDDAGIFESRRGLLDDMVYSARSYTTSSASSNSYMEARTFCTEAKAKSEEQDDDMEGAFSELESPRDAVRKAASLDEIDDEAMSESELSEGESIADDLQNELETLNTETDAVEKIKPTPTSAMTKAILAAPALSVSNVLDKWIEKGNEVTQNEISLTMFNLRKRRLFFKALQLSQWLESTDRFVFNDSNYASRVDLIAKVRGIYKAEEYVRQIPESFRSEIVYRTLLANCVAANHVKKSEDLFNKVKKLFPITVFSCNQMLLLYKKHDKKKIPDVLKLMADENIKPSAFTYQMLIDARGQSNEIKDMEKIVEAMKSEGVELDSKTQFILARHYASNKMNDKSEAILKEMEGGDIMKNRWVCRFLLPVYASLGKEDEVERIWKACESNSPRVGEGLAAIESFGLLNRIKEAEEVFEKMVKKSNSSSSRHFIALLKIYANHKMLDKGKDLVKRMSESNCKFGPVTWDALIKLYVGAGEVEKADAILEKVHKQKKGAPLLSSYLAVLDTYATRGDVHNAEKIFLNMRQAGYVSKLRPYRSLIYAYINAKAPAYGFRERLKGDNVHPNKALAGLLARSDAFRKSPLTELLD